MPGMPAEASMLMSVPRLAMAYDAEVPDASVLDKRLPSPPQDIEILHSKRSSMSGISLPSIRRFAPSENSTRLMAFFWYGRVHAIGPKRNWLRLDCRITKRQS
jgi:hypothetical protein